MATTTHQPITEAARQALAVFGGARAADDLTFLENWELQPQLGTAAALRVGQIRRAHPALAEAIRREIRARRT